MYQSDFQKAIDCIKVDTYSLDEFLMTFGENDNFDQKEVAEVQPRQDQEVNYDIQSNE